MVFTDARTLVLNLRPARPAIGIDWVVANDDVTVKSHELLEALKSNARGEVIIIALCKYLLPYVNNTCPM